VRGGRRAGAHSTYALCSSLTKGQHARRKKTQRMQPTLEGRLSRELERVEVCGGSMQTPRHDGLMRAAAADDLRLADDQAMRRRALEDRRPEVLEPAAGRRLAERLVEDDRGERRAGGEVRR
jgi:hypothetical protein